MIGGVDEAKAKHKLGRFDKLGSGVINIHKYLPHYSGGADPLFEDTRK